MYKKNLYLGQKILFAMFFSWDLETQKDGINTDEEKKVHPKYVKYNDKFYKDENIYSVLKYYGYEIEVVTGYEKAILELRRKDINNKCIYNSLWVISGKEVPEVPNYNKTGDPNDPYYVNQFVDCAIKFWQNGGSLVLMAENEPYTFQINLILKKLVFPDGKKVKFEIGGNHLGGKILKPDFSGNLTEKQTFNAKIQLIINYERQSLAHNITKFFEGDTVSHTKNGIIEPFIPFSRDSEGGINSLFYLGKDKKGDGEGEGDIFIDCGYTKFFLKMKEWGTSQYLQNIGGFIGSSERRCKKTGNPGDYRPDGFNFTLNKNALLYNYPKIPFDVVYLVDATLSMQNSINSVKNYCKEIAEILSKDKIYNFRFGGVFYRDPIDTKNCKYPVHPDIHEYIDLTDNLGNFKNEVGKIIAYGGGDIPEDWVGGYHLALHGMNWLNGKKLIIHITDAGAHGTEYSQGDKYNDQGVRLDRLITECSNKKIIIVAFQIKNQETNKFLSQQSFERVKMIYANHGNGKNFRSEEFDQNKLDKGYFTSLVVGTITKVTSFSK